MCNALAIEPVITTTSSSAPAELADLVEYCHGDATATPMGRQRAADGHPAPYRVKFFELGNEQYNTQFVEQVAAMEERATVLGLNGSLVYIFPENGGLSDADTDAAKKLGIDSSIAADIHVGPGGAVDVATALWKRRADFGASAVNLETNAGTHHQERALQEAADLNAFFAAPAEVQRRLLVRTASFCTSRSGHFDAFDQGISFFLPNMTWLQPPGHVHAMVAASFQPNALSTRVGYAYAPLQQQQARRVIDDAKDGGQPQAVVGRASTQGLLSVSAQASDAGDAFVVRVVNPLDSPKGPNGTLPWQMHVRLPNITRCSACDLTTLAAEDPKQANPSWAPDRISPKRVHPCALLGGRMAELPLVPFSYNVLEFTGCA